ncbi:hypothetical protein JCM15519_33350 [Fundidesulfovibrio butyratiphilus]
MNFDSFAFLPRIAANIARLGYETPTPIQQQAIPPVREGKDVMGLAQTGTGKTAAFMLPIIERFLKNPARKRGCVRSLVIAPTRELAEQLSDAAQELSAGTIFKAVTVYGGVSMNPQIAKLRAGADLVVACPGRLLDHVNQGHADLSGVEVLVLDEADHMFDMGFLPDIKRILAKLPSVRQTLLFSATMPESIRGLANDILVDPVTVKIGHAAPAQTVAQAIYPVEPRLKTKLLLALLGKAEGGSVLVFTRTKHRAKRLAEQIGKAGHRAAALQGNLSQRQRQAALDGFRDGRFDVLVATDIAARGIDVTRVGHVINFDIPDTPETYTHRVGRTGRAERTGMAHTLVTREDQSMVRAIERLLGKPLPRRNLEGFDYRQETPPEHDLPRFHAPSDRRERPFRPAMASDRQDSRPRFSAPSTRGDRQGGPNRTGSDFRQPGAVSVGERDERRARPGARPGQRPQRPHGRKPLGDRQPSFDTISEYGGQFFHDPASRNVGERQRRPRVAREQGDRQPRPRAMAGYDDRQPGTYDSAASGVSRDNRGQRRAPRGAFVEGRSNRSRGGDGGYRQATRKGEANGNVNGNVIAPESRYNPFDFVQPVDLYPGGVDAPAPRLRASYVPPKTSAPTCEPREFDRPSRLHAEEAEQKEQRRPERPRHADRSSRDGSAHPTRRRVFLDVSAPRSEGAV